MRILKFYFVAFFIFFELYEAGFAQTGMTVPEFKAKLMKYFNEEMIEDVFKKLPQNIRYTVWGWDVGDFSGDDYPDLAFSIKVLGETRKVTYVYLFVDIEGYLELVFVEPFDYFELPLEIGISIRNKKCSITQKRQNDFWVIKSYTFDNGVIYLAEEYTSQNYYGYGLESTINYIRNQCNYKIESLSKEPLSFNASYFFIPSHPRNKYVYKGYPYITKVDKANFTIKGSYYWYGEDDASFEVKSSYDDSFLYFTMTITDDYFIPKECDSCAGDKVILWFDFQPFSSPLKRMFKQSGSKIILRDKPDGSIYRIDLNLGNLLDKFPFVESINSSEPLDEDQVKSIEKIKVFFSTQAGKYVLKFRIPFTLFGYQGVPLNGDEPVYIGFNVVYVDVDNEFRQNEATMITNSVFNEVKPCTFGELVLVPDLQKFSYAKNIYLDSLLHLLEDFGF
jgi:hypothetical protein